MKCVMQLAWDNEAEVWYSASEDVPMFLESESYDKLVSRLTEAVPDYLLNEKGYHGDLELIFQSNKPVKVLVA